MYTSDADYYNAHGCHHQRIGQYNEAISCFSKAIEHMPGNPNYRFNRGWCCVKAEQYEMAIQDFTFVLRYNAGDAEAYHNRGLAHQKLNDYYNACSDFSNAIYLAPNDDESYFNRGISYCGLEEKDHAIKDLEHCLWLNPQNEKAKFALAQLKIVAHKPPEVTTPSNAAHSTTAPPNDLHFFAVSPTTDSDYIPNERRVKSEFEIQLLKDRIIVAVGAAIGLTVGLVIGFSIGGLGILIFSWFGLGIGANIYNVFCEILIELRSKFSVKQEKVSSFTDLIGAILAVVLVIGYVIIKQLIFFAVTGPIFAVLALRNGIVRYDAEARGRF